MAISKVDWALQFARLNAAPIDASQTIDTLANLRAALNAAKSKYYAGQLVSVTDDGDNNGAYRVTGVVDSLSVMRVDGVPIVKCKTHDDEHGDSFKWEMLSYGGSATLVLPNTKKGDKVYIGIIASATGTSVDVERTAISDMINYSSNVSDAVTPVGEITLAADEEAFTFINQGNEDTSKLADVTVFITTDKGYYEWLCAQDFYYGVSEGGLDGDYGTNLVQYYYAKQGVRMFYVPKGVQFCVDTFDTPVFAILSEDSLFEKLEDDSSVFISHSDFYGLSDYYIFRPKSDSDSEGSSTGGSAFNFVGSITSFPSSYATGDMWFLDPDGEEMTKPSNITLVGFKKLSAQDFLLCLDAEANKFTVLQSNLSVDLFEYAKMEDVPAASNDYPQDLDGTDSAGTSLDYARADHKHTIRLGDDCGLDAGELFWSNYELNCLTKHVIIPSGWEVSAKNGTKYTVDSSADNSANIQLSLNRSADIYNTNYYGNDFRFFADNVESLLTRCLTDGDVYTCGLVRYNNKQYFAIQKANKIYLYDMSAFDEAWLENSLFSKAIINLPIGTNAFSSDGLSKYTHLGNGNFQKETYVLSTT